MDATRPVRYPSFRLQCGREPVAGRDFSEDATFCQDDYEYYTGTGRYTNNPAEVNEPDPEPEPDEEAAYERYVDAIATRRSWNEPPEYR